MTKVLFYTDVLSFGGHEFMTLQAARYLAKNPAVEVFFAYSPKNIRLTKELNIALDSGLPIVLVPVSATSSQMQSIKSIFFRNGLREITEQIQEISPDILVAAQNQIDISILGIIAARNLNIRTISYLPLPQEHREKDRSFLAKCIHNMIAHRYFLLPDKFITVCNSMQNVISKHRDISDISVVFNGINPSHYNRINKSEARRLLGFSDNDYIVGILGRVLFRHKAQDFLVRHIAKHKNNLNGIKFLIVGDGPDKAKLYELLRDLNICSHVILHPMVENVSRIYSALDLVAMPSWFEGFPLVMLESFLFELPIIATKSAALKELLPDNWLCHPGDGDAFIKNILTIKANPNAEKIAFNKARLLQDFRIENFFNSFSQALGIDPEGSKQDLDILATDNQHGE